MDGSWFLSIRADHLGLHSPGRLTWAGFDASTCLKMPLKLIQNRLAVVWSAKTTDGFLTLVALVSCSFRPLFALQLISLAHLGGNSCGIGSYWFETMPVIPRDTQENGKSGLPAPITGAVCAVSVVTALTLCRFYMLYNAARRVVTDPRLPPW